MTDLNTLAPQLSAPFPISTIQWRAGATTKDKTRALALAYIDVRAVMNRLDQAVGVGAWSDTYRIIQLDSQYAVECTLTINGISKTDVGELSNTDPIKGAYSDALKRVAVKFGIGRYLYDLPKVWVNYDAKSKQLSQTPTLPKWAVPATNSQPSATNNQPPATDDGKPFNRAQQKAFHALGRQVYGDEWDTKRPDIVEWKTGGRTRSSKDLTAVEMTKLVELLEKKLGRTDKLVKNAFRRVGAEKLDAINDEFFG